MNLFKILPTIFLLLISGFNVQAQASKAGKLAPKPLFRDPVYDGAADPVVIWNKAEKKWFMFYTNRRAKDTTIGGVEWVHGTRIGIAESKDGATWRYRDTADIGYRPTSGYTHWAPEIIEHKGLYHMYLTYVPGVFKDWAHPRNILHLTSKNLLKWKYESTLKLASDKLIDACVFRLPDGNWRMWYNNERDHKSIYYADSKDLYTWVDGKKAVADQGGEGPKVFEWKGKYWMITDVWRGLAVYSSANLVNWKRQPDNILQVPGTGTDDGVIGGHADILVHNNRAYIIYFTHPGRTTPPAASQYNRQRSSLQIAELKEANGIITCDRDTPTYVKLNSSQPASQ
ncbi:family 43 glycosylhydrolase [Mucilaginibacter terrae]|uniref:family 43 glycosylhydrolase n=1 Tax=Mucilaginibacter terrae TaxID=1955052 RepID=UPI00366B6A4D